MDSGVAPDGLRESLQLLHRVKAGDPDALDLLFRRYSDRLLRIVRARLGREMRGKLESVDVLQEVWLKTMDGVRDFQPSSEGALLHWFAVNIERKIKDLWSHFRAAKRDLRAEEALDAPPPGDAAPLELPGRDPTPSQLASIDDKTRRIEGALDRLDEEQRELVILHVYEDLSFDEIGGLKGKTAGAVRMAFSRAMAKVASLVSE